jgi:hypothetical protein
MSEAEHLRREAARATRLAKELFDALTRERLQGLAADYLKQAIELVGRHFLTGSEQTSACTFL